MTYINTECGYGRITGSSERKGGSEREREIVNEKEGRIERENSPCS